MRATIGGFHGDRRHAGGRREETTLWLSTVGLIVTLALGILVAPLAADTQPAGKVWRLSFLALTPGEDTTLMQALLERLHELGYSEGKNMTFAYRSAEGRPERLPPLALELVRAQPDVLLAGFGTLTAQALKAATTTIPIVFTNLGDPAGAGLVASLGQPGGNVTGLTDQARDLPGKRLQLLRELTPGPQVIAVLVNPDTPFTRLALTEVKTAADAGQTLLASPEARTADQVSSLSKINWVESIVLAFFVNLIAAVAYLLFLSRVRPKLDISSQIARTEVIEEANRKRIYQIKILNRTGHGLINVRAQLQYLRVLPVYSPTQTDKPPTMWDSKEIRLKRSELLRMSRYSKKDDKALYAFRFIAYDNVDELLKKPGDVVRFQIFATHGLSGFSNVFVQFYTKEAVISGDFGYGEDMRIWSNRD